MTALPIRNFYILLILAILGSPLPACKARTIHQIISVESIAQEALGQNFEMEYNESGNLVLCQQNRQQDHANRILKYIVIQVRDKSILNKGNFQDGYIKWITNDSLELGTTDKFSPTVRKQTISLKSNNQ